MDYTIKNSGEDSVEIVADDNNGCGEGPVWDVRNQRLIWDDISNSLVYQLHPETGEKSVISHNLMVAGIALNADGRLVFAGETGVNLWRGQDDYQTVVSQHECESLFFNDILADSKGRLYAGTAYWGDDGMEKTGCLYLIERDGSIRVLDEGIEMSNGLGLSPDGSALYFADSAARKIYAYDVDASSGVLSNRRVLVSVPNDEGIPDGLTVDAEGFIWSAQWYGWQVVRYDSDGKVERRLKIPAQQVSSVAFGGKDLNELYITSAGDSWSSDLAPPGCDFNAPNIGGALYRVRLDIAGREEHQTHIICG